MKTILQITILCWLSTLGANAQWIQQNAAAGPVFNLQTINSQTAWCTALTHTGVLRTTDGGANWNATNTTALFPKIFISISLSAISADTAWYLALQSNPSKGLVYKTTDGGVTWEPQVIPLSFNPYGIHFFDSQNGLVLNVSTAGRWDFYTTTDGGDNWVAVPLANFPPGSRGSGSLSVTNAFYVRGNTVWFTGKSQNNMVVLKSTDRGYNWTSSTLSIPSTQQRYFPETIAFRDSLNGLLAMDSILFRTSDGGTNWQQVAYNGPLCSSKIIAIPGTATYLAVGSPIMSGAVNYGSAISTDDGNTWTMLNSLFHKGASFVSRTVGWIGGINYAFKYNGNPLGLSEPRPAATAFTINPNPGKGAFSVLNTPNQPFTIEVFNLTGAKILQQQGQPFGDNAIDLIGQPKGLYVVRIISQNMHTSRRLILQ